jgi:hypothetical protein
MAARVALKSKRDITEDNSWENPEIDGKPVPFAELLADRDPTELPAKAITPIEMAVGTVWTR